MNPMLHAPPRASAMLESLRGLGYTTASALADIIDNSVAARARNVALTFTWAGAHSVITILDDGVGMSRPELEQAMHLGARSPLEERAATDLGRFGLGLKTASFSQCRRLTVASVKSGSLNCLRWDLDFIASADGNGWYLLEGTHPGSESLLKPLADSHTGTLVVWECLDRIVTPGFTAQDFLDSIDGVERHLSMVFHRFLTDPRSGMRITINGKAVQPWDPFLIDHPATWSSPAERLQSHHGVVEVRCHVLPHRDRLSAAEYESAGGVSGWTAQQGFYVYRNRRLLLPGSWLGLGRGRPWTKEEPYRLARIRLDLTNAADTAWKIDIRKSLARPPVVLRERITRLAEDTRERARRVFAQRGQALQISNGESVVQAWRTEHLSEGVRYRIDTAHPAVQMVVANAAGLRPSVEAMLRVIEATVPVQRIWLDTAETHETPRSGFAGDPPESVMRVLSVLFDNMVLRKGLSRAAAREQLLRTEPFNNYPDFVAALGEQS